MTGRTHDLTAFTLLHIVFLTQPLPAMSIPTAIGALGMTFIGGLAPDIDQPTADLWGRLPAGNIIGRMITPILGSHRMISHSFVGIFLFAFGLRFLLARLSDIVLLDMEIIWWSFMIGYVSHLLVDLLNKEGIPLFFPLPFRFGIPPVRHFRIKTSGMVEKTLLYPALFATNIYLVYTNYQTYLHFFRSYIG